MHGKEIDDVIFQGRGCLACADSVLPFIPATTVAMETFDPVDSDSLKRWCWVPWELASYRSQASMAAISVQLYMYEIAWACIMPSYQFWFVRLSTISCLSIPQLWALMMT